MGGGDTSTPNDGTTDTSVDDGTSNVDQPANDGTDSTEQPNETEEEDPVKAIQKLTGKLSQKMRDTSEKLESEDIKYILNSIISASDVKKLNDEDRTDITNKIEDKEEVASDEVNEIGAPVASFYTASGGQTIGENKNRLEAILEQARQNVKNKLNKNTIQ